MCALLAQAADHFYLEGGLRSALRISSSVDTISESVSNPARWLGIDAPYLLASMVMIGVSGFLSLGLLGPMLWPARGQQDTLLVVMIVVGLLRTFMLLYGAVKKRSGYFLREAEKMIVDVGESAPDPAPETTEATEATEATAPAAPAAPAGPAGPATPAAPAGPDAPAEAAGVGVDVQSGMDALGRGAADASTCGSCTGSGGVHEAAGAATAAAIPATEALEASAGTDPAASISSAGEGATSRPYASDDEAGPTVRRRLVGAAAHSAGSD